jgi:hypothetical protein
MKGKFIFGILLGIFFIGIVAPLTTSELNEMSCLIIEQGKGDIIGNEIPEKVPFKNEILNVYLAEESFGFLKINESIVSDIGCGENENPTYEIYIKDYSVFTKFEQGFDIDKLDSMLGDEIIIKGIGFGKKFNLFFIKAGLKITSWFI